MRKFFPLPKGRFHAFLPKLQKFLNSRVCLLHVAKFFLRVSGKRCSFYPHLMMGWLWINYGLVHVWPFVSLLLG